MCSLYHGVGLFSLIFLNRKGATVSKVLEKRVSIVCYIIKIFCIVGYAEDLGDKSGRLLTKQSFVVEVMVLPYL